MEDGKQIFDRQKGELKMKKKHCINRYAGDREKSTIGVIICKNTGISVYRC